MSMPAFESPFPPGELREAERRVRLYNLAFIVFRLAAERSLGVINHEFDGVEDADLIDALRACSLYVERIGCLDFDDFFVELEGVDGHKYLFQFSFSESGVTIGASRVSISTSTLGISDGPGSWLERTGNRVKPLDGYTLRLDLGRVTTDRAFLVGMALVIGFMDETGDDPDEDARLAPLVALVMPTSEEWREIRARRTPSAINSDEEGDMAY